METSPQSKCINLRTTWIVGKDSAQNAVTIKLTLMLFFISFVKKHVLFTCFWAVILNIGTAKPILLKTSLHLKT